MIKTAQEIKDKLHIRATKEMCRELDKWTAMKDRSEKAGKVVISKLMHIRKKYDRLIKEVE